MVVHIWYSVYTHTHIHDVLEIIGSHNRVINRITSSSSQKPSHVVHARTLTIFYFRLSEKINNDVSREACTERHIYIYI